MKSTFSVFLFVVSCFWVTIVIGFPVFAQDVPTFSCPPAPKQTPPSKLAPNNDILSARLTRRKALVIGNVKYDEAGAVPLVNPVNDARSVSLILRDMGYTVEPVAEDLTYDAMVKKIQAWTHTLDKDTVAVFYYAGHGQGFNGENYFLPTDNRDILTPLSVDEDTKPNSITNRAVSEKKVVQWMHNSGCQRCILILDCCRVPVVATRSNNLPVSTLSSQEQNLPRGTFVAYATSAGRPAFDGTKESGHSEFTGALLKLLEDKDKRYIPIQSLFIDVSRAIKNKAQVPDRDDNFDGFISLAKVPDDKPVPDSPIKANPFQNLAEIDLNDFNNQKVQNLGFFISNVEKAGGYSKKQVEEKFCSKSHQYTLAVTVEKIVTENRNKDCYVKACGSSAVFHFSLDKVGARVLQRLTTASEQTTPSRETVRPGSLIICTGELVATSKEIEINKQKFYGLYFEDCSLEFTGE